MRISDYLVLHKINSDMKTYLFKNETEFDIIYFDAFGPDKQPDMWENPVMSKIYKAAAKGAFFVTYSAKGSIRRLLEATGFAMERLPGPPGKRQMLRGAK